MSGILLLFVLSIIYLCSSYTHDVLKRSIKSLRYSQNPIKSEETDGTGLEGDIFTKTSIQEIEQEKLEYTKRLWRRVSQSVTLNPDNFSLREAEIKHGRIAMLAAVGWPLSELEHSLIASDLGLENLLVAGKAPSVLNGGLDRVDTLIALGVFFAVGTVLEIENARKKAQAPQALENFYDMWREEGWDEPGNYGFDPLGLSDRLCPTKEAKVNMQKIEVFNGRLSMLATVGFAIQEAYTGLPVVQETPEFFQPWQ